MRHTVTNGTSIAHAVEGEGRPLLLLHGTASSSAMWKPMLPALAARRRTIAPDLRGHGDSDPWPSDASPSLAAEAAAVAAIAVRFGGAFDLVGHSYGGAVALRMAALMPRRIASLTLIEPAAFQLLHGREGVDRQLRDQIAAVAAGVDAGVAGFVDYWNGAGFWASLSPNRQAALARLAPTIRANFSAIFDDPLRLVDCAAIAVPTLLIAGERSTAVARRITALLGMAMPHARTRVVEGAGHMVPRTHPVTVQQAICANLARINPGPAPARRPIAA